MPEWLDRLVACDVEARDEQARQIDESGEWWPGNSVLTLAMRTQIPGPRPWKSKRGSHAKHYSVLSRPIPSQGGGRLARLSSLLPKTRLDHHHVPQRYSLVLCSCSPYFPFLLLVYKCRRYSESDHEAVPTWLQIVGAHASTGSIGCLVPSEIPPTLNVSISWAALSSTAHPHLEGSSHCR